MTLIHGLTSVEAVDLPARQQAMTLFLQAHAGVRITSASSIIPLAYSFDRASQQTLRECLSMLYAIALKLSTRPGLSFGGSIIFLQCIELLVSSLPGSMLDVVAGLLQTTKHTLDVDRSFVCALRQGIESRIVGCEPKLGSIITTEAGDLCMLAQLSDIVSDDASAGLDDAFAEMNVSMDGDDLLVVDADGNVAFLRPPHFRLDERFFESSHVSFFIFEDAPLVGGRSMRMILDAADPFNTLNAFRPLLNRLSERSSPESRIQIELMDE